MTDTKPLVVGRTWADLIHDSQTGPKLDAAMARMVVFATDLGGFAADRVRHVLGIVDRHLESANVEPKAIPERVGIPVMLEVALEDREEIQDLWAALLVGAATGADVDAYSIGLVKQLNPDAAKGLTIASRALLSAQRDHPDGPGGRAFQRMAAADLRSYGEFLESVPDEGRRFTAIGRLVALGLIDRTTFGPHYVLSAAGAYLLEVLCFDPGFDPSIP